MKPVDIPLIPADICHNLRPCADGSLAPVGRPATAAPAGLTAITAFSAPEGPRLLCADAGGGLHVCTPGASPGAPFFTAPGQPLCAEFTGGELLVMYADGLRAFSYPDLTPAAGSVPDALPVLLAAEAGSLRAEVAPRTLAGGDLHGAAAIPAADARAIEADYRRAAAAIAAEARARGVRTEPVLARYVLEDRRGNAVFSSPPVLLGRPRPAAMQRLGCTAAGLLQGYTLTADAWRLQLRLPHGLDKAGIGRVRVMVTPQFHTVLPDGSDADLRLGRSASGAYTAYVAVGLTSVAEALSQSSPDAARHTLLQSMARFDSLSTCAASVAIAAGSGGELTIDGGADSSPEDEHRRLSAALRRPVVAATADAVLASPPHSFSARSVALCGRTLMWGAVGVRRFAGYPAAVFAASVSDRSWRAFVAVDFADGSRCVRTTAGSTGAPVAVGPLLCYPAPDAVAMTIGLDVAGASPVCRTFGLSPVADGRFSAWLSPDLMPVVIDDAVAVLEPPEAVDSDLAMPDCIIAADAAAPDVALCSARGFGLDIKRLLPAAGGTAAWDFGRERVAVFSTGGIFSAAINAARTSIACGRIDGRRVESAAAVARGSDGDVYALASGALVRLRGRSASTLLTDASAATALGWDSVRRELWMLGPDGGTADVLCDALPGRPRYTRAIAAGSVIADTPCGSLLSDPSGVLDISRELPAPCDVAWQTHTGLPAPLRPRRLRLAMCGTDLQLLASVAAAGMNVAEPAPMLTARIRGDVHSPLVVGLLSRPLRHLRLRIAGRVDAAFRLAGISIS